MIYAFTKVTLSGVGERRKHPNFFNDLDDCVNIGRLLESVEAVNGIPGPPIGELAFGDFNRDVHMIICIGPNCAEIP